MAVGEGMNGCLEKIVNEDKRGKYQFALALPSAFVMKKNKSKKGGRGRNAQYIPFFQS